MKLDNGALTFTQAERWFKRIDELAADGRIDLADVSQVDSAGIALLLEVARRSRQRGIRLELQNTPAQLRGLLEFFGVSRMLGLSSQPTTA